MSDIKSSDVTKAVKSALEEFMEAQEGFDPTTIFERENIVKYLAHSTKATPEDVEAGAGTFIDLLIPIFEAAGNNTKALAAIKKSEFGQFMEKAGGFFKDFIADFMPKIQAALGKMTPKVEKTPENMEKLEDMSKEVYDELLKASGDGAFNPESLTEEMLMSKLTATFGAPTSDDPANSEKEQPTENKEETMSEEKTATTEPKAEAPKSDNPFNLAFMSGRTDAPSEKGAPKDPKAKTEVKFGQTWS